MSPRSGDSSPPTVERCRQLLAEYSVPPHICRHSEQVERVSGVLAEALCDAGAAELDPDNLRAAALLHDIAKMPCIESRMDHAAEGCRLLVELGMPIVADLVGRHVRLGVWDLFCSVEDHHHPSQLRHARKEWLKILES